MNDDHSTEQSNQLIQFDGREQAKSLALQLTQQAQREICFFGNNLDPILFDNIEFVDCISEFARRSDKTTVKFLVHSTQANIQNGHRLLPLIQRLTSSINLHITAKQHQGLTQMFMLVDNIAYFYYPNSLRYQGRACFYDPSDVRDLKKTFSSMWDQSSRDIMTRRLNI
ncbi:MAG: hypothetical protein HRT93_07445 [Piscirickettsiaceae bacterium]|nr:hypothetical protein [Piscirickettsiaceae bacterium]